MADPNAEAVRLEPCPAQAIAVWNPPAGEWYVTEWSDKTECWMVTARCSTEKLARRFVAITNTAQSDGDGDG